MIVVGRRGVSGFGRFDPSLDSSVQDRVGVNLNQYQLKTPQQLVDITSQANSAPDQIIDQSVQQTADESNFQNLTAQHEGPDEDAGDTTGPVADETGQLVTPTLDVGLAPLAPTNGYVPLPSEPVPQPTWAQRNKNWLIGGGIAAALVAGTIIAAVVIRRRRRRALP